MWLGIHTCVYIIMCASCLFSYLLVSDRCEDCGIVFGAYACLECRIFDNLDDENSDLKKEGVFHCDLCGICRIGKRSEFVHCSVCNCCRRITSSSSSSNSSSPLSSLTSSSSGRRREWEEEEDSQLLDANYLREYRAIAARANYLAMDRADLQFAIKE